MKKRYYVAPCEDGDTISDGPNRTWDVCDRQRNDAAVSNHSTRGVARQEAARLNDNVLRSYVENEPSAEPRGGCAGPMGGPGAGPDPRLVRK